MPRQLTRTVRDVLRAAARANRDLEDQIAASPPDIAAWLSLQLSVSRAEQYLAALRGDSVSDTTPFDVRLPTPQERRSLEERLQAAHRNILRAKPQEKRAHDTERRVHFEANENWLALLSALNNSTFERVPEGDRPYPVDLNYVPSWALHACIDLVNERLHQSAGKGRHARFTTRHKQDIEHQRRWLVWYWCVQQGVGRTQADLYAAEYLGESDAVVKKSRLHIERIRKRAASLAADPAEVQTMDPIFDNHGDLDLDTIDAMIRWEAERGKDPRAARARDLLDAVRVTK